MKIDVHAHLYPRHYLDEVLRLCRDDSELARWCQPAARATADPRFWSVERRLAELERMAVDLQVLSLPIPGAYVPDRAAAVALCQMGNDAYLELARQYPARFRVFASVPLHFPDAALAELARVAEAPEVVGVVLGSNAYGKPLDHPDILPFYAELERRGLPFFIHPMCCTPGAEALEAHHLRPMVGYLLDSTVAALRLVFAGVFERHPGLTFIMPHLGAMAPYILGRVEHQFDDNPLLRANVSRRPIEYFQRFYYDTVSEFVPALRLACEVFGPDHIVFGTDIPFWNTAERIAENIAALGLAPEQQEAIFSGNARRILPKLALG